MSSERKEALQYYQRAYTNLCLLAVDVEVPQDITNDLIQAIELDSVESLDILTDLILYRKNTLTNTEKMIYLRTAAVSLTRVDASYEMALAAIGTSTILTAPNKSGGWWYFYRAAYLGLPNAFTDMLEAICRDKIIISPGHFLKTCQEIYAENQNYNAALVLAGLIIGRIPRDYPQLGQFNFHDPVVQQELGISRSLSSVYIDALLSHDNMPAAVYANVEILLYFGIKDRCFPEDFCKKFSSESKPSLSSGMEKK